MPAIILLTVQLLVSFPALAGPRIGSGGGGGAVVCQTTNGIRAELVDLVESAFYDKTEADLALAQLPWREQVKEAVNRLAFADPEFSALLVKRVRYVLENLDASLKETLGTDLIFPAPQDLSHGRLPPMRFGCQLVGGALFNDSNVNFPKLTISDFIWRAFDERNKAALIMHESIYLTHRDMYRNLERAEAPDSSSTRALVGYVFSKEMSMASTLAARAVWSSSPWYQSPVLKGRDARFVTALLPYNLRGKANTLFVERKKCPRGAFIVRVQAGGSERNPRNRCELQSVVKEWPAKYEVFPIHVEKFDVAMKSSLYFYKMRDSQMLEELRLVCPSSGLDRFNPGFKLYCGEELLAEVPSSERNASTGLAIRKKVSFSEFLKDFE